MKKHFLLLLLCAFFPLGSYLWSQTHVSGKVIDENGQPIAFANVLFPKTTIGAYTDDEGRFSLYSEKKQRDQLRSEERRVGKECRSRWSPYH